MIIFSFSDVICFIFVPCSFNYILKSILHYLQVAKITEYSLEILKKKLTLAFPKG